MTIAATYPAAVIAMARCVLMKGSLLEENIARTVGSIGESVAAGAIFTIPAFVMAGLVAGTHEGPVLEVGRADDDRRHPRHPLRDAPAPRDGRGSRPALSRIRGRLGDSQGGPAGSESGEDSVRQHGLRRASCTCWVRSMSSSQQHFPVNISAIWEKSCCSAPAPIRTWPRRSLAAPRYLPRPTSVPPISAWDTSLAPGWPP